MATNNAVGYEKAAYSIDEFCRRNSISRRTLYNLLDQGIGPRTMKLGGRRLISAEAETAWHRELENEAAAAPVAPPAKVIIRRPRA
jgi:predicted DNA-binding transcriptional regulator AlpA